MHQQMTQKRRPRINFMKSWSGHTQSCREIGDGRRERKIWPRNRTSANDRQACMRVQMKMASDWSTLPQAGKWRSKVRTSCTNESTSKPGTPQMDTPSAGSITDWHFFDVIHVMAWRAVRRGCWPKRSKTNCSSSNSLNTGRYGEIFLNRP
jgi:hypothetical protein